MSEKLGEVFVEILGDADPFAEDFADAVGNAGEEAEQQLSDSLDEATEGMADDFTAAGEEAGEGLAEELTGAVEDVPDEYADLGAEAGEGLADELAGAVEDVPDEFADVGSEAGEGLAGSLDESLSGVADDVTAVGAEAGEGFAGELTDAAGDASIDLDPAMAGVVDDAAGVGADAGTEFSGALEAAASDLSVDVSVGLGGAVDEAQGLGDEAGEAFASAAEDSAEDLDVDAGGAFDGVLTDADSAAGEISAHFVSAAADATSALQGIEWGRPGATLRENSFRIGAGLTGAAVGAETFARSQQESNAVLDRTAIRLGVTDDSLRDLISSQVDHTWSAADAATSMEVLTQRGIDTRDELERQLPMWDEFADATGQEMPAAIEGATRGLGAFNISAKEAPEHMDTITYLATELDVDFDVFGRRMGRVAGEMKEMDLTLNDGAAALTVFRDRGMSSRDAMNEVRDAVKESEGDMDSFLDIIGLTAEEWEEYQGQVGEAEGMTAEFAKSNNENMTLTQEVQANLKNLAFRFGGVAEAAGLAGAGLGAVGPAMMGLNQGIGAAQKIGPKLVGMLGTMGGAFKSLALTIWANPLFLIGAVIIGIIAIAWHFREEIMAALGAAFSWIGDRLSGVIGWFRELPGRIMEAIQGFLGIASWLMKHHPLAYLWRFITGTIPKVLGAIGGLVMDVLDWFADLRDDAVALITRWLARVVGFFVGLRDDVSRAAGALRDRVVDAVTGMRDRAVAQVRRLVGYVTGFPGRIIRGLGNIGRLLYGVGKDLIQGLINGATSLLSKLGRIFLDKVPGFIRGPLKKALGIGSPSTVFEGYGRNMLEGLTDGIDAQSEEAIREIERFANEASEAGRVAPPEPELAPVGAAPDERVRPEQVDRASGGGGPLQHVEQTIYSTDPKTTARLSVRELRKRIYLDAPYEGEPYG